MQLYQDQSPAAVTRIVLASQHDTLSMLDYNINHIEAHYLSLWSEPMVKTSLLGNVLLYGSGYRIRTGVNAVKGHYPRPLDEPTI